MERAVLKSGRQKAESRKQMADWKSNLFFSAYRLLPSAH